MNPALFNNIHQNNSRKGGVKFADLHLHTVYSDSTFTVDEVVAESKKYGISAISIVDHDTVEAIESALITAAREKIEVIPGIELTAEHRSREIHILGYFIDFRNEELKSRLKLIRENRIERIYSITAKLKSLGVSLNPQRVFEISGQGVVGRMHIARAMLAEGIVSSIKDAFRKFIGDKCPAYAAGIRLSVQEAVEAIRKSGGVAVLAHPYTVENEECILSFIDYGLMGLEVYYPEHSQSLVNYYLKFCKKYNLLVTGGSDCHGTLKPEITVGCVKIPYELVEKIKQAREDSR